MPSASRIKDVLFSDPDAFFEPLARTWLRSRSVHPLRWQVIDLAYGAAGTVVVWLLFGRIAGIVVAAVWAVLIVLGLVAHGGRLFAGRKRNDDDRDDPRR